MQELEKCGVSDVRRPLIDPLPSRQKPFPCFSDGFQEPAVRGHKRTSQKPNNQRKQDPSSPN